MNTETMSKHWRISLGEDKSNYRLVRNGSMMIDNLYLQLINDYLSGLRYYSWFIPSLKQKTGLKRSYLTSQILLLSSLRPGLRVQTSPTQTWKQFLLIKLCDCKLEHWKLQESWKLNVVVYILGIIQLHSRTNKLNR